MCFSHTLERQIRFTFAVAELKSALIEFLNIYNEILKRRRKQGAMPPLVSVDYFIEVIFRQQMADDTQEKKIVDDLIQKILDFPGAPASSSPGNFNLRLQKFAGEEFDAETCVLLKEMLDQLTDIPDRIRGEVWGEYIRAYALKVASEFELRVQEVHRVLNEKSAAIAKEADS